MHYGNLAGLVSLVALSYLTPKVAGAPVNSTLVTTGTATNSTLGSNNATSNGTLGVSLVQAPALPSLQDCKDHLSVAENTCIFYSGGSAAANNARAWSTKNTDGAYKVLAQQWTDDSWPDQWQNDDAVSTAFFNIASRAYVELCSGTMYVMLAVGSNAYNWPKGRIWDAFEWPYFTGDDRVVRVNANNDNQDIIRGSDSPLWPPVSKSDYANGGTCSLHATQWDLNPLQSGENRYDLEIRMYSTKGTGDTIGYHPIMNAGPQHTFNVDNKSGNTLVATPEAENDYIQFTIGTTSWKSSDSDETKDQYCKVGGWDGSDYPSYRQMDCYWAC